MTKLYGLYRFPGPAAADSYEADDGRLFPVRGRFVAPPDFNAADVSAVIAAIPGAVEVLPGSPSICPVEAFSPRKIIYTRSNGSTLSLIAPDRNIMATSFITDTVAAIDAAGNFPVLCAALEGETVDDMYSIYVPAAKTAITPFATGNRPLAAAGIQYYFTGVMDYETDYTPFASNRILPFKIASDLLNAAPTLWAATLAAAPFSLAVSTLASCGASDPREPRHFIATNAIGAALATATAQQTKIPLIASANADIANAATILATVGSTYCLAYKGESNPKMYRA